MAAIVALILLLGVYYINYTGAIGAIPGLTDSMSISNLWQVFPFPFMPPGQFFAIARGLIFALLGIFMFITLARLIQNKGYHKKITRLFALTSLLTIAWVIVTALQMYLLSVIIIAILMVLLIIILNKYRRNWLQNTFGRRAFGAYYGRISIATTVLSSSILIYLYHPAFVLSTTRTYIALAIGLLITLFSRLRRRNPMALLLAFRGLIGALVSFLG